MKSTLNLWLNDELRAFVDENSGEGPLYATPSEFVCDLLRHKKDAIDAAKLRDGVIEGYQIWQQVVWFRSPAIFERC